MTHLDKQTLLNTKKLFSAISQNNTVNFNDLIQKNIDWQYVNTVGENLLSRCDNLEMAKILVDKGVNAHHLDEFGCNVLFHTQNKALLQYYISLNVNYHLITKHGFNILSPTFLSGKKGYEKVKLFIDLGVNYHQLDPVRNTLLHHNNHLETIKLYINLGLDIHATNRYKESVIFTLDSYSCLKYLLEQGANPNGLNAWGQNALCLPHNPNLNKLKLFIKHGGNAFCIDNNGNNLLHLWVKDVKATQYLMNLGLDSYLKNKKGETPRDFAKLKQIPTYDIVDSENEKNQLEQLIVNSSNKKIKTKI